MHISTKRLHLPPENTHSRTTIIIILLTFFFRLGFIYHSDLLLRQSSREGFSTMQAFRSKIDQTDGYDYSFLNFS